MTLKMVHPLYARQQGIHYYTSLKAVSISCGLTFENRRHWCQTNIVCFVELAKGLHDSHLRRILVSSRFRFVLFFKQHTTLPETIGN